MASKADCTVLHRRWLASLTASPALRFGDAALRGRIAPGMAAELVVLGDDPVRGARAFSDVRWAIRGGRVLYRSPAAPKER